MAATRSDPTELELNAQRRSGLRLFGSLRIRLDSLDTGSPFLDQIERDEMDAQRDPQVRAARLAAFKEATAGKVWWRASNGEQYLIRESLLTAGDGLTARTSRTNDPERLLEKRIRGLTAKHSRKRRLPTFA